MLLKKLQGALGGKLCGIKKITRCRRCVAPALLLLISLGTGGQAAEETLLLLPDSRSTEVSAAAGYRTAASSGDVGGLYERLSVQIEEVQAKEAQRKEEEAKRIAQEEAAAKEAAGRKEAEQKAQEAATAAEQTDQVAGGAVETFQQEKELLAALIFCEAGNQSFTGQVAVGAVVLNRMASSAYPDTMEEVIYQSGQFGPAGSGWLDRVRSTGGYTASAMEAAEAAMAGENPIGDCLFFDQGGYGCQIGAHYFH